MRHKEPCLCLCLFFPLLSKMVAYFSQCLLLMSTHEQSSHRENTNKHGNHPPIYSFIHSFVRSSERNYVCLWRI